MKPLLLDLFCGAGGATKGYQQAGFHVVGVDINPQPNYCGDEFVQDDVFELWPSLTKHGWAIHFSAIHASPPCQAYSQRSFAKENHPRLIAPMRDLLDQTGLPYVIENVEGARSELRDPIMLCGSSFRLRVQRHRLFESNIRLSAPACAHAWQEQDKPFIVYDHKRWFRTGVAPVYGNGGRKAKEYWPSAMGCGETWDDCWMTPDELKEAIPPAYTKFLGHQIIRHLERRAA